MGLANRTPLRGNPRGGAGRPRERRSQSHAVPGYVFRIVVTICSDPLVEIWRTYNRRSDMENRIAELKHDLGARWLLLETVLRHRSCLSGYPAAIQLTG